ncbi:MAG: 30S ribosomal protein S17 [Proteobacteria bacterium]|nr:30S ribosomal protein S17 [Pseudomonadota bacterium]
MKVKVLNIIDAKTFKAVTSTYKKHTKYQKYITVYKKYLVDSSDQKVEVGQEVEIFGSRPLSKRKRWSLKVNQ